jgi:hypothetical protein
MDIYNCEPDYNILYIININELIQKYTKYVISNKVSIKNPYYRRKNTDNIKSILLTLKILISLLKSIKFLFTLTNPIHFILEILYTSATILYEKMSE